MAMAEPESELEPSEFDEQTAEIFLNRLNKALGVPERTTLTDALIQVTTLRAERDRFRGGLKEAWEYFHQRIQGLTCGLEGTWEQALNELTAHIKNLYAQIRTLQQQQPVAVVPPRDVNVARLAPPANGTLQQTDRALLIEEIPNLIARLERLEKVVFPPSVEPS